MAKRDRTLGDVLGCFDNETALGQILDNTTICALMVAPDGKIISVNDAGCRMFGRSKADLISCRMDDLIHPDDLETGARERESIIAGRPVPPNEERRYVREDGRALWTRETASLLPGKPRGEPPRVLYVITDITPQKEILLEKERLQLTLQSIADAVMCTDTAALVTFMNPLAERLTGWTAADACGRPAGEVLNLIDERSGRPPVSPIEQCMAEGRALTLEVGMILLSRNGDAFDIGFSAAPVPAGEGVLGSVVVFNDLTKINADRRKVARSALHDSLTGLPNRGAFIEKLAVALAEAREEGRTHALCFIDLDRFKLVNDRGGHAAGDALLSHVAKIIALSCSSKDVPARLGGDEFAVLIRDCSPGEAERTAGAIVHAVGDIEFRWDTQVFRIGASVGATIVTDASTCLEDILHEADQACYQAKNSGRGQVHLHHSKRKPPVLGSDPHPSKWLNIH